MVLVVITKGGGVPCLVGFFEDGGISGHILANIFRHLDDLGLYDNGKKNSIRPVLLVDVHGSHFDLEFFKYIRDENHKWTVVFGVPYGTPLWQVGDSSEQNGTYKIYFVK